MTYIKPDDDAGDDELETEADQFAADTLVPPSAAAQLGSLRTSTDIIAFADQIGVDSGIVAAVCPTTRCCRGRKPDNTAGFSADQATLARPPRSDQHLATPAIRIRTQQTAHSFGWR